MTSPALVVMAAGIGRRYGGIKQLDPVGLNGEIILDYSIYDALQAGFENFQFVINRNIEDDFKMRVKNTFGNSCNITYLNQDISNIPPGFKIPPEREKPWGTAHAVLSCKDSLSGSFGVINADDFYGRSSFGLLYNFLAASQEPTGIYQFCLVGYRLENTLSAHGQVARGVCRVRHDGYLDEVTERTHIEKIGKNIYYLGYDEKWIKIKSKSIVSMNMWGFTDHLFNELEKYFKHFLSHHQDWLTEAEFFLPDVVNQLLAEKKAGVKVLPSLDRWFGVTYPSDKPLVTQAIQNLINQGIYPEKLWG